MVDESEKRDRKQHSYQVLESSTPCRRPGRGSSPSEAVCSSPPPACSLGGSLSLPHRVQGKSAHVSLLSFHRRLSGHGQESGRAVTEPKAWLTAFQRHRNLGEQLLCSVSPDLSPPDSILRSMENMQCHAYMSLQGPFLHQTRL